MLKEDFNGGQKPAVKTYHIHIYYDLGKDSENSAKGLAKEIARLFPQHVQEVHEYDKPGGPHAVSNVAVHFGDKGFGEIVQWLQFNAGNLSMLVHPKSGDVIKDHIDYGLWLGPARAGLLSEAYFLRKRAEKGQKPPPSPKNR
jgi:aromatic ring-cleaving dioxygenase